MAPSSEQSGVERGRRGGRDSANSPVLNLFAKLPIPGAVKTRLARRLGDDAAAALAEQLIHYTLDETTRRWPGERVLWLWPHIDHALSRDVRDRYGVDVRPQPVGNLGLKMMVALERGLNAGRPCAVMGCDLVHCEPSVVERAGLRLRRGSNVFGAALDGGFWLLGLNASEPTLFDGIDWQGDGVGAATLRRAAVVGVEFDFRAPALFDIDRPEDWDRLKLEFPAIYRTLCDRANIDGATV